MLAVMKYDGILLEVQDCIQMELESSSLRYDHFLFQENPNLNMIKIWTRKLGIRNVKWKKNNLIMMSRDY